MYPQLDNIKEQTIILIQTTRIMMIHSHMRHLRKKLPFLLFWWYNLHHNHTTIFHTLSTWKRTYMFSNGRESAHAVKSIVLIEVLKAIFDIDSFEQQCVIIKGCCSPKNWKNTWLPLRFTNHYVTLFLRKYMSGKHQ